jgi:DNA-binding PadR family transcriptional regulator
MTNENNKSGKVGVPQLTHLQYAVLDVLRTDEMSGKGMRKCLSERGIKKSGPAFYQMMARLEEAKLVEGWYVQEIVEGQIIKERRYRIIANGIRAMQRTEQFYNRTPNPVGLTPSFA